MPRRGTPDRPAPPGSRARCAGHTRPSGLPSGPRLGRRCRRARTRRCPRGAPRPRCAPDQAGSRRACRGAQPRARWPPRWPSAPRRRGHSRDATFPLRRGSSRAAHEGHATPTGGARTSGRRSGAPPLLPAPPPRAGHAPEPGRSDPPPRQRAWSRSGPGGRRGGPSWPRSTRAHASRLRSERGSLPAARRASRACPGPPPW